MKPSVHIQKKNRPAAHPRPAARPGASIAWRRRLLLTVVGVMAGVAVWALLEFVVWNRLPGELVGKWVVVSQEQEGATFDFYRGGTMVGRFNQDGREAIVKSQIEVDGKRIYSTSRNPNTGKDETMVLLIRTLNDKKLVVQDGQGKLMEMERAE